MAVRLRLRREGTKKQPHYRVVAADKRAPRNGKFIEIIGEYHPMDDPSTVEIDHERALHWLRHGAQPSSQVKKLLRIVGVWQEFKPGDEPTRERSKLTPEQAQAAADARAEAEAAALKEARAKAAAEAKAAREAEEKAAAEAKAAEEAEAEAAEAADAAEEAEEEAAAEAPDEPEATADDDADAGADDDAAEEAADTDDDDTEDDS